MRIDKRLPFAERATFKVSLSVLSLVASFSLSATHAGASCDLHVRAIAEYPSTQGVSNRPFAAPGEGVQVSLRDCDVSGGLSADPAQHNVTIIFTPPSGERTAVVLTSDVDCSGIQSLVDDCEAGLPGSGKAFCVPGDEAAIGISTDASGKRVLGFRFPDTDARCDGGADHGSACRQNSDCASGVCDPSDDDRTLSGPAKIVVTDAAAPLQCGMDTCGDATGTLICIDEYFRTGGSCLTSMPAGMFPGFTALAPPNNYANECIAEEPPCNLAGATDELRGTLDARGNLLTPFVWDGIREQLDGQPVARLLSGTIALPTGDIGQSLVSSHAVDGRRLDPVFEPKPTGGSNLTLFGSADAPYTILRVARGSDSGKSCVGGTNAGVPCNEGSDCDSDTCEMNAVCVGGLDDGDACINDDSCDGGVCGAKLFDLSPLLAEGGVGPVVLDRASTDGFCQDNPTVSCSSDCGADGPCVSYALKAGVTVPLESLVPRDELGSFVVTELIDLNDVNNDGDTSDVVMTQRDPITGQLLEIAPPSGCGIPHDLSKPVLGRAVVRSFVPPLRLPAGATENGFLGFVETESGQNGCDLNGDGDAEDGILRLFDAAGNNLNTGFDIAVDPTPTINGRSLVLSNGLLFVRVPEVSNAARLTTRANVTAVGGQATGGSSDAPSITQDGQWVAFASGAGNLTGPADNAVRDVFAKNLLTGSIERVNDDFSETDPNANITGDPYIRKVGNSNYVTFASFASNMDPSDPLALFNQLHVWRTTPIGLPKRFSGTPGGAEGDAGSFDPRVGYAGRVVFLSDATNLDGSVTDNNGNTDVYWSSSRFGATLISRPIGGGLSNGTQANPVVAADEFVIAFESSSTNLVTPDTSTRDIFVYDGSSISPFFERASTGPGGVRANGLSDNPEISDGGRFVSFDSSASNLVVGDTNGDIDVFVRDRLLQKTYRVSVATGGGQANGDSRNVAISPNGVLYLFKSDADNLVSGDTNGGTDYFLHNLISGETVRVNVDSNGNQGASAGTLTSFAGGVSSFPDAEIVFESGDAGLVVGDTNSATDVIRRTVDPNDPLGIDDQIDPNGVLREAGLMVLDVTSPSTPTVVDTTLQGRLSGVRVADGKAAYLKEVTRFIVVDGQDDDVLHFWEPSSGAVNLNRGIFPLSTDLSLLDAFVITSSVIGMFVAESAEYVDENGNGIESEEGSFQVHDVCSPIDSCGWTVPKSGGVSLMTGVTGLPLAAEGDIVAVPVTERETGPSTNLNASSGDFDETDVVLHVYDHSDGSVFNTEHAIVDVVVGDRVTVPGCGDVQLVAYRVSEADQGPSGVGSNLNDDPTGTTAGSPTDSDANDNVLHVYNAAAPGSEPVNTRQAASACVFSSCDPRTPYRVEGSRVIFLTAESEQGGEDLSGEGDPGVDLVIQNYDFCGNVITTIGPVTDEGDVDPTENQDSSRIATVEGARCDAGDCAAGCDVGEFCELDRCLNSFGRCERHLSISCSSNDDCDRCIQQSPITCDSNDDCLGDAECNAQLITAVSAADDDDFDGVPNSADSCPDDPNPTQSDVDGDGTPDACDIQSCPDIPLFGCRPAPEGKASIQLKDRSDDTKDQLKWKWSKGEATSKLDYGDPAGSDTYEYCLYDASSLVSSGVAQGGKLCGSVKNPKPCWKENSKGFKFKDKSLSPLGVSGVLLKEGEAGKPKVSLKGKGEPLIMPTLPSLASPLTLQLHNNSTGECWTATFAEPYQKDEPDQIKAKSVASPTTTTTTTSTTTTTIPGVECSPFLQDCAASEGCYVGATVDESVCAPAGSSPAGASCSGQVDCVSGAGCFSFLFTQCMTFCGPGLPSCGGLEFCNDLGSTQFPDLGACVPLF